MSVIRFLAGGRGVPRIWGPPALALLITGCVSPDSVRARGNRARPLPPRVRPDAATLDRFARTDDNMGKSAVAIIAAPAEIEEQPAVPRQALTFDDVMRSVETQFPLILAALQEVDIANAELLRAEGGFDAAVKGDGQVSPQGFYENEQGKLVLEQPTTAWGATPFVGYKIGSGDFPVWEGGLQSNEEGEFAAGVRVPLLKGREIDQRRVELWKARIGQAQADPIILQKRLEATRKAAFSYWKWVAAGQKLSIARRLLQLADSRTEGIAIKVEEGDLAPLAITENQRLVVDRESIVIRSVRALQEAAIGLSLFWRGADGQPVVPTEAQLPEALPTPGNPDLFISDADLEVALRNRPEVRQFELAMEQVQLDIAKAENDLLPKLDLTVAGSQDIGDAVSTPDDKGPFELDILLGFDVPVQRRAASGKLLALDAKLRQAQRKMQFARESIIAEVQDGQSAVRQTWLRLAKVRENAALAGQIEEAERVFLEEGQSDLLRVNLREQTTASAASILVDVIAEHFRAVADYRASLGLPYDEVLRGADGND
ncbi:MAG: TolC family protein [Planctomycetota bacterium]